MTKFSLRLDSDAQGEPPCIYVVAPDDSDFAEIFLEPIQLVEEPDSFEDGHWDFPDIAKRLVSLLNQYC
jgi:hypothetical protein